MSFKINGCRIILRIPEMKDAKAVCKYIDDKAIARYTTIPHPYKLKHAKDFVKKVEQKLKKKESYEFSILLKETGEIVGGIGLLKIDKANQNAEVGYWLARKY